MTDKYKILKEFENNLVLLMDILGSNSTDNIQLQNIGAYLFKSGKKNLLLACLHLIKCQY